MWARRRRGGGILTSVDSRVINLAIIVVSYNVRDLLRRCLEATYAGLARSVGIQATVWVVDNASADGSAEMVAQEFPQAVLIPSAVNLGFAAGNNLALKALGFRELRVARTAGQPEAAEAAETNLPPELAQAAAEHTGFWQRSGLEPATRPDLVLLLNPDAEPQGEAIEQMARFLMSHPRVGGAGAHLRYPDGRFQHGAFRFPGLLQLWFDFFPPRPRRVLDSRLNGRYPRRAFDAGEPFPIDFALGAALMVRREAIEATGLLDTGYFMYVEEVDWCWRMQRAGWPLYCVPAARVIHHGGASTRQFRGQSFFNLWRSRQRLYRRFYGRGKQALAVFIVQLGMQAEARRARAAAARGDIGAAECEERMTMARRVANLFAGR